jgi:hypothetical protein
MLAINPQYITDTKGNKVSVVLAIEDFKAIMEKLEELEDIELYDKAKKEDDPSIPIEDAFKIIEATRAASCVIM